MEFDMLDCINKGDIFMQDDKENADSENDQEDTILSDGKDTISKATDDLFKKIHDTLEELEED